MKQEDNSRVLYRTEYFDIVQDINATLVMSQIHYWYMPNEAGHSKLRVHREGQWWLAKSAEDWWKETRLTKRQVERALQILESAGLIRVRVWKFKGSPTRHIICDALDQTPIHERGSFSPVGAFQSTSGDFPTPPQVQSITETTAETTAIDLNALVASTKEQQEQIMLNKNPGKGKVLNSSKEILKQLQAAKGTPKTYDVTTAGLIALWRETVPKHNPSVKFVPEFTMVQKGMLSQLIKRLAAHKQDIVPTVELAIERWTKYTKFVQDQAGVKTTPCAPSVSFLLKYCAEAHNLFLAEKKAPQPAAPIAPKQVPSKPMAPAKVLVEENAATLDELKELGAKFGFGTET